MRRCPTEGPVDELFCEEDLDENMLYEQVERYEAERIAELAAHYREIQKLIGEDVDQ